MNRWAKDGDYSWVPDGDLHADPLADLMALNNSLSLWHIEDDLSNMDDVIVALAANMDIVQSIDYLIFSSDAVAAADIGYRQTPGKTPFEPAQKWHYDLVNVSALRLVALAKAVFASSEAERRPRHEILGLLADAVKSGRVDLESLKEKVRIDIAKAIRP